MWLPGSFPYVFFFLFMIQRGNKYERDLLAVRPQPEDGALVQPCQVFLPCSSWHFRLNHDLVEFRGENLSLEGRTSWEVERLEGEVMHHHGTGDLRQTVGKVSQSCPAPWYDGIWMDILSWGPVLHGRHWAHLCKRSFNREKRSGPVWFWELGRQRKQPKLRITDLNVCFLLYLRQVLKPHFYRCKLSIMRITVILSWSLRAVLKTKERYCQTCNRESKHQCILTSI